MSLEETLNDSCAEWLNSLLRAPTVREGSSTFSLAHFKSLLRAVTVREGSSTRQHTLPLASNVCRDDDPPVVQQQGAPMAGKCRERPSLTVGALSGSPDAAPPASPPILLSTAGFLSHAPSGRMSLAPDHMELVVRRRVRKRDDPPQLRRARSPPGRCCRAIGGLIQRFWRGYAEVI